jgi:hypothetical protein
MQHGLNSVAAWCDEDSTRVIYFSHQNRLPGLMLHGQNIPFANNVKYLDVIFDQRMTWSLYIETIKAKAFQTFIRLYSLFKSERLSANIKLTLHKALIRSIMTYACPSWEFAAEIHLLKLQCLQNKVLSTFGNFPRCTSVRDMHVAFHVPHIYDCITKLCRRQAEIIHNHENENVRNIRWDETL